MNFHILVDEKCVDAYTELKVQKKWRYVIYNLDDDFRDVSIYEKGPRDKTLDDFLGTLRKSEAESHCRLGVYDVEYQDKEVWKDRTMFFNWVPKDARTKEKTYYGYAKESLKKYMKGLTLEVTIDDDVSYDALAKRCRDAPPDRKFSK